MMVDYAINEPRQILMVRIKWLMSLRLMLATFSLGTAAVVQIGEGKAYLDLSLLYLYSLIGIVYCLSLVYASVLKQVKNLRAFAFIQLFLDILLISALVNVTGGVTSDFSLFYYLSIIGAGIILYRRGGLIIASVSSIIYALMIAFELRGIFRPTGTIISSGDEGAATVLFSMLMNITAFYLVAFLSGFLSEQVRLSNEALKEKESDYQRLETLHKNIIESINSGLLTVNQKMNITFFNRAAEVITGHRFSEVKDKNLEEIFPGLLHAASVPGINNTGSVGPALRFEIPFQRHDGRKIYLGFSKSTLKDGEKESQGEVYTFQDVTRLKEMEEQVKMVDRLAAVGRLASGMAHEIRNPLASMSGSIQVLGQTLQLDDDNKRLMDIVLRETHRLDQLLSDFILFTHPDDRRKKVIELNEVIMDTVELFLSNPNHTAVSVVTDLKGSILLEADPHQIKQVLWNLFANAHQAMNGGGELRVSTNVVAADKVREEMLVALNHQHNAEWVCLEVADTGCGIDAAHLDKIFDPFFTTKPTGSGLGLAIVYSIIESYKGHISVKSQQDQGTTFTILLPLRS